MRYIYECRYANVFYRILIKLFHLLGVDYVQQSAQNERCRIMSIYSTVKRQKNQKRHRSEVVCVCVCGGGGGGGK